MRPLTPFFTVILLPYALYGGERTVPPHDLPLIEPGQTPEDKAGELRKKKCLPCEGKVKPLTQEEENEYAQAVPRWELRRNGTHKLLRQFVFKSFQDSIIFVNAVADIAEEAGHHPNIEIFFNSVILELYTHAIAGLSENDFILAARIDEVAHKQRMGRRNG